jgi:hypothetical protein
MPLKHIPMGWTSILLSHVSFSANCLTIFEWSSIDSYHMSIWNNNMSCGRHGESSTFSFPRLEFDSSEPGRNYHGDFATEYDLTFWEMNSLPVSQFSSIQGQSSFRLQFGTAETVNIRRVTHFMSRGLSKPFIPFCNQGFALRLRKRVDTLIPNNSWWDEVNYSYIMAIVFCGTSGRIQS